MNRNTLKNKIIKNNLIPYECNICHIDSWLGNKLSLHLDHINGINNDNRIENLRFLCPNCHSQTETYCAKNNTEKYGIKNRKISNEVLIKAMLESKNPTEALKLVGLAGAGNYQRVYRLAVEHNIDHMKHNVDKSKKYYNINCKKCNKEFYKLRPTHYFCSIECKKKNNKLDLETLILTKEKYIEFGYNYSKTGKYFNLSYATIKKRIKKLDEMKG